MKRFQFKLAPVLKFREFQEDKAKEAVAQVAQQMKETEEEIDQLRKNYSAGQDELEQQTDKGISMERFRVFTDYLDGLVYQESMATNKYRKLTQMLEQKKKELGEAAVARKVIENLKKRQRDAYQKEMTLEAQKEIDDMVIVRKARERQS